MAEAFTAGVRPGGLTDDTQIRMLLCYLVKVAGPVKRETMQGALLQEQLVNYFEFADALAEVEKQQLVTVDEDGRYTITRRGTTVADTLAVLEPMWQTKPRLGELVRDRIRQVLDAATATGIRTGPNPADWAALQPVLRNKAKSLQRRRNVWLVDCYQ